MLNQMLGHLQETLLRHTQRKRLRKRDEERLLRWWDHWEVEAIILCFCSDLGLVVVVRLTAATHLTTFIQVSSVDQGFGPTQSDAVYHYHSIYDSQHWQETYGDPDFSRHVSACNGLLSATL